VIAPPALFSGDLMISTMDIAWAAGFLEGEGSFGGHNKMRTPCVRAGQVQREPLERLQKMFGGHIRNFRHVYKDGCRRQEVFHTWYVYGKRAAEIGMTLYCLLSPRRQGQCKKMLDGWKTLPSKRERTWQVRQSRQTHCKHGHEFTPDNTKIRMEGLRHTRSCRECHRADGRRRYAERLNMEASHKLLP